MKNWQGYSSSDTVHREDTVAVFKTCFLIYKMDIIKVQTYGVILEANVND